MIEIDGSVGEGGGQIVRASVAYSCLTGKPVRIFNIRAKRRNPGLRRQHATAIKILSKIFDADVKGCEVGSRELVFTPAGKVRSGAYTFDIGTAGSITLVLQAITFALIGRDSKITLTIKGGTDVPFSPAFDYFNHCYLKLLSVFGYDASVEVVRRGYYPAGGGIVKFTFNGHEPKQMVLDECEESLTSVNIFASASAGLNAARVCERMVARAANLIHRELKGIAVSTHIHYSDSLSPGAALCIVGSALPSKIIGADELGRKGTTSEKVAELCVAKFLEECSSGCVDSHLADHLIPFLAVCGGAIKTSRITTHTSTMIWLAKRFLGVEFEVNKGKVVVSH